MGQAKVVLDTLAPTNIDGTYEFFLPGKITYRCADCGGYWHKLIEVCLRNGDIEPRCGECLKPALDAGRFEKETMTGLYMEIKE